MESGAHKLSGAHALVAHQHRHAQPDILDGRVPRDAGIYLHESTRVERSGLENIFSSQAPSRIILTYSE